MQSSWSVYAQWAEGSIIPPSSVFDVPDGQVLVPPKPTLAKTYQVGSVMKHRRWTLDADAYYIHFQNGYDTYTDPSTLEPVFVATGPSNTKGIEAETNFVLGYGFSLYANGSMGSAKYQTGPNYPNGGLWVANAPKNVETVSLLWHHRDWECRTGRQASRHAVQRQRHAQLPDQRNHQSPTRSIRPSRSIRSIL